MLLDNMNRTNLCILANKLSVGNPHNPQIESWVRAEVYQRNKLLEFKEKVWQKQKKKKQNGG